MKYAPYFSCLFIIMAATSSQAIVPNVDAPANQTELIKNVPNTAILTISNRYTPIHPVNLDDKEVANELAGDKPNETQNSNVQDSLQGQDTVQDNVEVETAQDSVEDSAQDSVQDPVQVDSLLETETSTDKKSIENILENLIDPEQVPLKAISPNTLRTFVTVVDLVRREYVEPVNDEQLFADAMQGMLKNLDPHAEFLDAQSYENLQAFTQGELANVGMEVAYDKNEKAWVVQSVRDNSPAQNASIKQGFYLHSINELQLDESISANDIEQRLKGIAGSMVEVVMSNAGRRKQKYTLQRTLPTETPIDVLFYKGIAVVTIPVFQDNTRQQVLDALLNIKRPIDGVVLDIRNNPGGVLGSAVDVAGLFVESKNIVQVEDKAGEVTLMSTEEGSGFLPEVPLIVLQNRYSASAAEVLSSGLQYNKRATIIGETSYGKGTVQSVIPIENNQAVKLTVAHYLRPDGMKIDGEGVRPDVVLMRDEKQWQREAIAILLKKR